MRLRSVLVVVCLVFLYSTPIFAADCAKVSSVCTDNTPCKLIGGVNTCLADYGETCWQWHDTYACAGAGTITDCQPLIDRGCNQTNSTCVTRNADNSCSLYQQTYQCSSADTHRTVEDCSVQTFCQGGNCFDTAYAPDTDLAKAAAAMEVAREAGVYDQSAVNLFRGVAEDCQKGFFGLKDCCKTNGGAMTNNALIGSAISGLLSAGGAAAGAGANAGSQYMYDFMYSNGPGWQTTGYAAALGEVNQFNSFTPSNFNTGFNVGAYGFNFAYGSPGQGFIDAGVRDFLGGLGDSGASALSMFDSANTLWNSANLSYSLGGGIFTFNPYSFAASMAFNMIMSALSDCSESSQMLGMHRDARLCHFVGSYCSNELDLLFFKICLETTESYCCFNSRLARIINEQGRGQVGKTWGSAESPDCSGFSEAQFTQLDFSQMNLSEFYNEVLSSIRMPNTADIATTATTKVQNFYGH